MLLKPLDPFFSKDGAGAVIPVKVSGTKSEQKFGLDLGHEYKKVDGLAESDGWGAALSDGGPLSSYLKEFLPGRYTIETFIWF